MRAIEIGPGKKRIGSNWKTMSAQRGKHIDYVHDITTPIPPSLHGKFDLVYMSHVLEHVPWFTTVTTLKHIRSLLRAGGTLEVWVPDFKKCLEVYYDKSKVANDKFRMHNKSGHNMLWLNGRIFAGTTKQWSIYTKISVWHKCLFDKDYLHHCLHHAGFKDFFDLEKPRAYNHGWINLGVGCKK